MAASRTLTGKAGSVTLNSVAIPITKWTCKLAAEYADSTDSSTFDSVSGNLWKKQDQGDIGLEGTIEGHFDLNTTATDVIALLVAGGTYNVTLGLNATTNFISNSPVSLTDGEVTLQVAGATETDFTANFKSYGAPTFG